MTPITLRDVPFEFHVEVWALTIGAIAIGLYVWRVLQPKAVAAGYEPTTRKQGLLFVAAVGSMWVMSDWPIHEIAEGHLYFVHMIQHLFLSMLIPALYLMATPRWLFELVLTPNSPTWRFLRGASRPLVAGVTFNALTVLLHWSTLVRLSFESGLLHFSLHLLIFAAGLLMWMPILSPVTEWRIQPMPQCIYLFLMSIVPTVPSGWLIFAQDVVYRHYDTPERLWGIDVLVDQTAAGVVMKLVGGFFLWGVIFTIFIRWAYSEMLADEQRREETLTYDDVATHFDRTPAPVEPK